MAEHMNIEGYTVVPVKASKESPRVQYVYLKKHQPNLGEVDKTKPTHRTLFVGNPPPWATESELEQLFTCCGVVEKVMLQNVQEVVPTTKKNHKVAFVIFKSKKGAEKALQLPYGTPLIFPPTSAPQGLARYKEEYIEKQYTQSQISELRKQITERMAEYDRKEREKEWAAKNAEPDEDGWVTVTRVGKNKGAPRTEAEDSRVKNREMKKRKRKELSNFYAFQNREMKKQKLEELRDKFQKDKSAVEKMKQQRKFRPF